MLLYLPRLHVQFSFANIFKMMIMIEILIFLNVYILTVRCLWTVIIFIWTDPIDLVIIRYWNNCRPFWIIVAIAYCCPDLFSKRNWVVFDINFLIVCSINNGREGEYVLKSFLLYIWTTKYSLQTRKRKKHHNPSPPPSIVLNISLYVLCTLFEYVCT